MMKSGKFKNLFSKKISWVMIFIILISICSIPSIITWANNDATKVIKILEIQPGNKYDLQTDKSKGVEVTHMDMPTFISKVDEISGQYDIVYLGRNNDGLTNGWNTYSPYRDYTAPNTQLWGHQVIGNYNDAKYSNTKEDADDGQFDWRAKCLWYGVGGAIPYLTQNEQMNNLTWEQYGNFYNYVDNKGFKSNFNINNESYDKVMQEYYSENDITNKRAKEIVKMIESNQLVYIDNDILNISNNNSTNLEKIFSSYKGKYENTHFFDGSVSLNNILKDYNNLSSELKTPGIELVTSPVGDIKNTSSTTKEEMLKNRNLVFKFKLSSEASRNYRAKLYLDYDGDGNFSDDGFVYCDVLSEGDEYKVEYKISSAFIGYLDWKLQIVDEGNEDINSYVTGNVIFENILGEAVNIDVLQLMPYDGGHLNMEKNYNFQNLIKSLNNEGNYNISIKAITIKEFNENASKYYGKDYNMIVLGFDDNYGNGAENQFNEEALKVLNYWNDNNRSLLFTHDTMNLSVLNNSKTINGQNTGYDFTKLNLGSRRLTQEFRSVVGQARYIDPFNLTDEEFNVFKNNNTVSLGITAFANVKLYDYYTMSTKVKEINSSQITSYPYDLSKEVDSDGSLEVSETHTQWYQLDLEDEDIVPAYDLTKSGRINSGDARNFYYTYSKGNITYSGAGHSEITSVKEMKLFINTMIKAIRGANEPPELTNMDDTKSNVIDDIIIEVENTSDFQFATKIRDDSKIGDIVSVSIKTSDGYNLAPANEIIFVEGVEEYYLDCTIPKDYLVDKAGNEFEVIAQATDKYGETSAIKKFTVKVSQGNEDYRIIHGVDTESNNPWTIDYITQNIDNSRVNKNYFEEVPFAAYIKILNSNATLELELDDNFINTSQMNGNYKASTTLIADNTGTEAYEPIVYIVKEDGSLGEYGRMEQVGDTKFKINLEKLDVAGTGYIENGYCSIIVKYNCKTYNHIATDNSELDYINKITVIKNNYDIGNAPANIYVGYKELKGNLF